MMSTSRVTKADQTQRPSNAEVLKRCHQTDTGDHRHQCTGLYACMRGGCMGQGNMQPRQLRQPKMLIKADARKNKGCAQVPSTCPCSVGAWATFRSPCSRAR